MALVLALVCAQLASSPDYSDAGIGVPDNCEAHVINGRRELAARGGEVVFTVATQDLSHQRSISSLRRFSAAFSGERLRVDIECLEDTRASQLGTMKYLVDKEKLIVLRPRYPDQSGATVNVIPQRSDGELYVFHPMLIGLTCEPVWFWRGLDVAGLLERPKIARQVSQNEDGTVSVQTQLDSFRRLTTTFDAQRGCAISEMTFVYDGPESPRTELEMTVHNREWLPGVWFPVEVTIVQYAYVDGERVLTNRDAITVESFSIGEIDERRFSLADLKLPVGQAVSDPLGLYTGRRTNSWQWDGEQLVPSRPGEVPGSPTGSATRSRFWMAVAVGCLGLILLVVFALSYRKKHLV